WGRWLGKLDLVIDTRGDSVYSYAGRLIETRASEIQPDRIAASKAAELESRVEHSMSEVIGELLTPWQRAPRSEKTESNIGNWQTDIMREYAGTDLAFQNAEGIRMGLNAGVITVGDIWKINPFGNHFVTFPVSGAMVRTMFEFQLEASRRELIHFSGMRLTYDSTKPEGNRILSIDIHGRPLNETATYNAVTNNYVASNMEIHFGIPSEAFSFTPLPDIDRDVFIQRIRKDKTISSQRDGRMRDVAKPEHK
ncbi:MAG: 5'-nucleotidase C-terminal domain-containing protein, partial [Bacteroidota bacterium]